MSRSFYSAHGSVVWLFNLNIAFLILAYIYIYGYGMLSMGFDCCLEEILFQSFEGTELD